MKTVRIFPLILSLILCGCTAQHPLQDLNGRAITPLPDADARATVLLFIAHDCPISNTYAPEIRRLCDAYAGQGIRFYLVYADPSISSSEPRKHYQEYGYTCPALIDIDHTLAKMAGATVTPEAAVFLPGQRLIYRGRIDDLYLDLAKPRYAATTHDLKNVLESIARNGPLTPRTTQAVGCHIPL